MAPLNEAAAPLAPHLAASSYSLSTLSIHGDDHLNTASDVAPALHVSTTFRYSSNPEQLVPLADEVNSPPST